MIKINITTTLWIFFIALVLSGCHPEKRWENEEESQIERYINSLGDTLYELKPSGLFYIELSKGTGRIPIAKDTVQIRYEAKYLDGYVFISNLNDSIDFAFIVGDGTIIPGIDEGVRYMKEGGKARLLTPSYLIYGRSGKAGYLPGYTPLTWQINLIRVRPGTKK